MAFRSTKGNNSRGNSRGGKGGKNKFKANDYKMLQFGVSFLDEQDGKADFKARIMMYDENAKNEPCVKDESNNVVETYTREEAASLVAQALLMGRGITTYFFDNDDSWGGNARIDISGLTPEAEEAPAAKTKSTKRQPRRYKNDVEDEVEEEYEDADDDNESSPY